MNESNGRCQCNLLHIKEPVGIPAFNMGRRKLKINLCHLTQFLDGKEKFTNTNRELQTDYEIKVSHIAYSK